MDGTRLAVSGTLGVKTGEYKLPVSNKPTRSAERRERKYDNSKKMRGGGSHQDGNINNLYNMKILKNSTFMKCVCPPGTPHDHFLVVPDEFDEGSETVGVQFSLNQGAGEWTKNFMFQKACKALVDKSR